MPRPVVASEQPTEGTRAPARVRFLRALKAAAFVSVLGFLCLAAVAGTTLVSDGPAATSEDSPARVTPGSATGSPAERRIASARAAIDMHPKRADGWNDLALALARRARETGDPGYYAEGWQATERALALEPGHLEARKLQVWILLGQHEFPRAVEAAEAINKEVPDEVLVYGFLADGYVGAGPLRRGREGRAVDARHASRQRAGTDASVTSCASCLAITRGPSS